MRKALTLVHDIILVLLLIPALFGLWLYQSAKDRWEALWKSRRRRNRDDEKDQGHR